MRELKNELDFTLLQIAILQIAEYSDSAPALVIRSPNGTLRKALDELLESGYLHRLYHDPSYIYTVWRTSVGDTYLYYAMNRLREHDAGR